MLSERYKIRQIFTGHFQEFVKTHSLSPEQETAGRCIMNCKTGRLGHNYYECQECGNIKIVPRSCGNRNCPNCQAVNKAIWLESRKEELIDAPYFHVVGTLPHELNPLLASNKKVLYELLHRSMGQTLVTLSKDPRHLGAVPGIIQVIHTWDQQMHYHVHVHCVVSGAGLDGHGKLVVLRRKYKKRAFFIPVREVSKMYRGKFLDELKNLWEDGKLSLPGKTRKLKNSYEWQEFINGLYHIKWNVYIKETYQGKGNAIEYLAKYTNRIAISNQRVIGEKDGIVSFYYLDRKDGNKKKIAKIPALEFIRRFFQHVVPKGFQKIRYYGYLSNSIRKARLENNFSQQGGRKYHAAFSKESPIEEIVLAVSGKDIRHCPCCGKPAMVFIWSDVTWRNAHRRRSVNEKVRASPT